jgi:hypothetical protein
MDIAASLSIKALGKPAHTPGVASVGADQLGVCGVSAERRSLSAMVSAIGHPLGKAKRAYRSGQANVPELASQGHRFRVESRIRPRLAPGSTTYSGPSGWWRTSSDRNTGHYGASA